MSIKLLPVTIAVGSFLLSSIAMANQPALKVMGVKASPQTVAAYWTPERMKNATPMEMPKADRFLVRQLSMEEVALQQKGKVSEMHLGSPPTVAVKPATEQLFKPVYKKSLLTLDAGTKRYPFTSQQLSPLSLDQTYPYSTVGKLYFTTPAGDKTCSAAVIGKRVIVTAAHCMHTGKDGEAGWYSNWMFSPAYRDGTTPLQKWAYTNGGIYIAWYSGGGTTPSLYDYGMLTMLDQSVDGATKTLGDVAGILGYKTLSTMPNHAHMLGYASNLDSGEKMHQVAAGSGAAVTPGNAEYGSDMGSGADGGPWIQNLGTASVGQTGGTNAGRNLLIGLTSYSYNDTTSLAVGGVMLTEDFTGLYSYACNLATGNC